MGPCSHCMPAGCRRAIVVGAVLLAALCSAGTAWATQPSRTFEQAVGVASWAGMSAADPDEGEEDCRFGDLGCHAGNAVTGWFRSMVKSAIEPTLGFLAETQFATPEIGSAAMAQVERIWRSSLVIANTCFVLLVTLGGVMLIAGETLTSAISPREVVVRLVAAFVAMNTSLIVIEYGISLANGLSEAILLGGERIDPDRAGRVLADGVEASVNTAGAFFILVTLVAVVMAVILVFIYVMRLAIIMVLVAIAPLALMFHALPQTDGIARLWWRGITGIKPVSTTASDLHKHANPGCAIVPRRASARMGRSVARLAQRARTITVTVRGRPRGCACATPRARLHA
jgi:hypothetical protein